MIVRYNSQVPLMCSAPILSNASSSAMTSTSTFPLVWIMKDCGLKDKCLLLSLFLRRINICFLGFTLHTTLFCVDSLESIGLLQEQWFADCCLLFHCLKNSTSTASLYLSPTHTHKCMCERIPPTTQDLLTCQMSPPPPCPVAHQLIPPPPPPPS